MPIMGEVWVYTAYNSLAWDAYDFPLFYAMMKKMEPIKC